MVTTIERYAVPDNERTHAVFIIAEDLVDGGTWGSLSSEAKAVYIVLCRFAGDSIHVTPFTGPGLVRVAKHAGITHQQARDAYRELLWRNLIDDSML